MKLGILTYHQSVNNGAVMQGYSLSKKIKEIFPDLDVEIIDYRMPCVDEGYSYTIKSFYKGSNLRKVLGKSKLLLLDPAYLKRMKKRTEVFRNVLDFLPLSEKTIKDNGTNALFDYINNEYDILVVGSDAIWNYISRGFPSAYLPDRKVNICKMSYAASCYGMDYLTRPESEREEIKESLDDFSFIGVRDGATEDFVKWSGSASETYHTCDPTVFLDINNLPVDEEKIKEKLKNRGFDFNKPAIGMMGSPLMFEMIKSLYGDTYQIVALYEYIKGADVNLYDLSPYEWAYVFRLFKLTFTTFFHGTLLSLRNGTPVLCIALETEFGKKHVPKTLDVLTRLGFEDCYFKTDYKSINLDLIKQKADDLLQNDYKNQILIAMDNEAKTFESFEFALGNILKENQRGKL